MGSVHSGGRITFGFRNINGRAYDIKILQTERGTFIDRLTVPTIRNFVVSRANEHGRQAEAIAKTPGHSPFLTGELIKSIKWVSATRNGFGGLITGDLSVGVPYGRRQEFEHKTKKLYLHRALAAVFPAFLASLNNKDILEEVILGRRKDSQGRF